MHGGGRPIVAVIDDDGAVRDSLAFLLSIVGFDVVGFASAEQFLAARSADAICLLVDQNLPEATGLDVLRLLRAEGSELPVALMTGSPTRDLVTHVRQLGAATLLEKPLQDDVLLEFVARAAG
jgi:two-component system, LuxR family, response regulator FixJ